MADIKTGNKGFVNPVDGDKVYTMDSVAPDAPGANESPPDYDPGNMSVDNTVRDISKKTRITLGTYLSKATKGEVGPATRPNQYPIDPSTDASQPSKITTQGYPTPLAPSGNSSQFEPILPSSFSGDYSTVQGQFKKGRGSAQVPDGNELLPGVTANNQSTQLVPGPVKDYTAAATTPNRWSTGGPGFTAGADLLNPPAGFDVGLQSSAVSGLPSVEVTTQSTYNLNLAARVAKANTETAQNVIDPIPSPAVTLTSLTTNEVPTPLAPTQHGFAPGLPSSFSNDYASSALTAPDGLKKGKTSDAGLDGNEFLPNVTTAAGALTGPQVLLDYTREAMDPNRWSSEVLDQFTAGDDILNPPKNFDVPGQSEAVMGPPAIEVLDAAKYELDLKRKVAEAKSATASNSYPATPGTPNGDPNINSITTQGYPSPLTPAANQNLYVHAYDLAPSTSPLYPLIADDFKKGKAPQDVPDGNTLLGSSIITTPQGTSLNSPIQEYTDANFQANVLNPSSPALPPELDVNRPPPDYYLPLYDYNVKGAYSPEDREILYLNQIPAGEPSDSVSLREIPNRLTQRLNEFPVDPTIEPVSSLTDVQTGDPVPLRQVSEINLNYYTKDNKLAEDALLPTADVPGLSRGKGPEKYNGNNLLSTLDGDVNTVDSTAKYSSYDAIPTTPGTESRGLKKKTSTPKDHPVVNYKGSRGGPVLAVGNSRFAFGTPSSQFNPTLKLADGTPLTTMKMAQVGAMLSQRASAEIPAWTSSPATGDRMNPNADYAEAGAILPSVNQLGILKVDDALLSADDALRSINDDFPTESLSEIAHFGGQSWGTLTNVSEPYDDAFNIGLFITALLMTLAIRILFEIISFFANLSDDEYTPRSPRGELKKGSYKFKKPSGFLGGLIPSFYEIFGVNPTNTNFGEALTKGTNAYFFGAENVNAGLGDILLATLPFAPGKLFKDDRSIFTALMTSRTIIRSGFLLAISLDKIIRSPNFMSTIRGIINILRTIRSSKFITSINVFSALGDIFAGSTGSVVVPGPDGKNEAVSIDHLDGIVRVNSTVRRNRLGSAGNYDPTLAWSSQRAPSMHLIAPQVGFLQALDANNSLGSFKGVGALNLSRSKFFSPAKIPVSGRISSEDASKFERLLEAEYVPFYFHDVRTNEIVSFHAFLTSLSDDYAAAYDSSEGFGRVEPIKTYKGTTRKIGLSFILASTSDEDFDHMWYNVNKLTTLVYPQYTSGKKLIGRNFSFTAPFSQLVGASPLVRIRLGDLFRSNYSRFALARLFGLNDSASIEKDGKELKLELDPNKASKVSDKLRTRLAKAEVGDLFAMKREEIFPYVSNDYKNLLVSEAASAIKVNPFRDSPTNEELEEIGGKFQKALDEEAELENPYTPLSTVVKVLDSAGFFDYYRKVEVTSKVTVPVVSIFGAVGQFGTEERVLTTICLVPRKILNRRSVEDEDRIKKEVYAKENFAASQTEKVEDVFDALSSFMDPSSNSITKSFESAGGKGLAGFIESMNFDWYNQTTWEISPGRVAPKMCKVTISFAPIHDITPGIDHFGYNRAPIYPVGDAMRSAPIAPPKKQ